MHAFGLNRADTLQREGKYPVPPGVSTIMGLEFAGTIEEVGPESTDHCATHAWKSGDEVFGLAYGGTYAEYVCIDKRMLLHKPAGWDWATAAGVCETWMTALQALHLVGRFHPSTHRAVLWHAGLSSVSIAGIQLCKALPQYFGDLPDEGDAYPRGTQGQQAFEAPKVFATARSDEKCQIIKEKLGADEAVNAKTHIADWEKKVIEANGGEGVDLIVDYVGASYFQQNLDVLARDGRVVQLATLGGTKLPDGVDIGGILRKRIRFEGSTLRSRSPQYQSVLRDIFEAVVLPRIGKEFDPRIDRVTSWKNIAEAHGWMEKNETKGKIVCTVD